MDSLTLRAAVAEINRHAGARVDAVRSPGASPWELSLVLERGLVLVLSADPDHNTLYVTRTESGSGEDTPFARVLESTLVRSRFRGAVQRGLDRVVSLAFETRDRLGDVRLRRLVAELTGKGADIFLVEDGDPFRGRIRARLRGGPGRSAYEPPAVEKPDATETDAATLAEAAARALAAEGERPRALVAAWAGTSPATAREVWHRAGADAGPDPARLAETWTAFCRETRPETGTEPAGSLFAPTVAVFRGEREDVLCFKPEQPVRSATPYASVSEAAESAHRRAREHAATERRSPRRRAVLQAEARVRNALGAQDREARDDPDPETLRGMGEALLASAAAIRPGSAEATVPDPRTDRPVSIKLNPKLSPSENAGLYFRRARKAERRADRAAQRRAELEARLDALRSLARRLDAGGGAEPDPGWFREARDLGVKLAPADLGRDPEARPEDRLPSALRPRRYTLSGGWEVLVGKSNRGNEVLTHEIARPHDTWLHADQAAGSHVVLRHHEKGKDVPTPVLLAAAAIAAYFSKARHAAKVPVLVTRKRFVRRIRKAPVGTVSVGQHKTVMVSPSNPDASEESR